MVLECPHFGNRIANPCMYGGDGIILLTNKYYFADQFLVNRYAYLQDSVLRFAAGVAAIMMTEAKVEAPVKEAPVEPAYDLGITIIVAIAVIVVGGLLGYLWWRRRSIDNQEEEG